MWWSSRDLYHLESLSVNFLAISQHYKIITSGVLKLQGWHGDHEIDLADTLRKVYFSHAGSGNDLVRLKILYVHGNRIFPNAIDQLKESRERSDDRWELRYVPVVENADHAYLSGYDLNDSLIAKQDCFAFGWRLPFFAGFLFSHTVPVLK
jgi:hypothetical protein